MRDVIISAPKENLFVLTNHSSKVYNLLHYTRQTERYVEAERKKTTKWRPVFVHSAIDILA